MINWQDYNNFSKHEFDCKHTTHNEMQPEFMELLQEIRTVYGKPMVVTSGYRARSHPVEKKKATLGEHTYGLACDIAIRPEHLAELIFICYSLGVKRFGINLKQGFLHIGIGDREHNFKPTSWVY